MGHMRGHFSEGLDDRDRFPGDEREGRFSYGEEVLPDDAPEKHVEGHFSDGLDTLPR